MGVKVVPDNKEFAVDDEARGESIVRSALHDREDLMRIHTTYASYGGRSCFLLETRTKEETMRVTKNDGKVQDVSRILIVLQIPCTASLGETPVYSHDKLAKIAKDIGESLSVFHETLVHKDVKPSNIVQCGDRRYRLIDFGMAKALSDERNLTNFEGTPYYLSPYLVAVAGGDIEEYKRKMLAMRPYLENDRDYKAWFDMQCDNAVRMTLTLPIPTAVVQDAMRLSDVFSLILTCHPRA